VQQGTNSGWSIAVDYGEGAQSGTSSAAASGRPKVDYQEVLDPKTFAVFTALRSKRKELADRDSIPAYAIITNEQMAKLSQMQAGTLEDLKQVEGFGDVRIAKYGQDLLRVLADFGPAPDLANPTEAF
jgi:superfamily II DNA helicase RecQ